MQAKRMETYMRIKKMTQIVEYDAREFMPHLTQEVEAMQKEKLEVEVQYANSGTIYSALVIGREKGKNEGSKTV